MNPIDHDSTHHVFEGMVGKSLPISEVFSIIKRVAPTNGTVCIFGESGTGKEMVANAIHRLSPRKKESFLACDCSSLSPNLLESELFGHVRGAFSGAVATKAGLFELAHKGTLFLDELANINLETQSKLLRVLESRRVKRVGDTVEIDVDIRLIAATNRDLKKMVDEGTFRNDLFYRLHVVPIHLPTLRERSSDIPRLVATFMERFKKENPVKVVSISQEAMELLQRYSWPGNVRELRNVLECIAILCDSEIVHPHHLPLEIQERSASSVTQSVPRTWNEFKDARRRAKEDAARELERVFLTEALRNAGGNVTLAAESVGVQRTTFHAFMRRHDLRAGALE